jgi:hypothetical protein
MQDAAAVQLKLAKSTLRERLERGRALLRTRLMRRGLGPAAVLVAGAWPVVNSSASVPASIVSSTVKAATLFAAGQMAAVGLISARAAALAEGVLRTMLLSKIKIAGLAFLAVIALAIGISGQTRETRAAGPGPAVKAKPAISNDGNLKETVLALERRIWEAHSKQDVDAFKNLLTDDFVGIDMFGRPYDKAAELDYVGKFRVIEYTMKNVKVVLLNATGALVTYQIDYKVRPTHGQKVENTSRRVTAGWAQRNGRWWYVYFEDKLVQQDRWVQPSGAEPFWKLRDIFREINDPKVLPKESQSQRKTQLSAASRGGDHEAAHDDGSPGSP